MSIAEAGQRELRVGRVLGTSIELLSDLRVGQVLNRSFTLLFGDFARFFVATLVIWLPLRRSTSSASATSRPAPRRRT